MHPNPECKLRDPDSDRDCPHTAYCAVCEADDDFVTDADED